MIRNALAIVFSTLLAVGCADNGPQEVTTPSGLTYSILQEGSGEEMVVEGDSVSISERLLYRNGELLYDTNQMNITLSVVVGAGQVIDGVDEGLRGMKAGEIRRLVVPTSLSHRSAYPDFISKDSILVYEIEVVSIKR